MKWIHGKKRMFMAAAISAIAIHCGVLSLAGWLGWTDIRLEPGTTDAEQSEGVLTSGYTFAEMNR